MKSLIVNLIILILIYGCTETNKPTDKSPCSLPEIGWEGWANVPVPHREQTVSYDLKKLAFVLGDGARLEVCDLKSGDVQVIDIESKLPSNVLLIGVNNPTWCPYDNNRLLIHASTSTDTNLDGKRYVYGQNLYILSLDGSEFKKVTPNIFGKAGGDFGAPIWLVGSNNNLDSLLFWGPRIYIPQKDSFINSVFENFIYYSHDQRKIITAEFKSGQGVYFLNGKPLIFNEKYASINKISFSPDGKLIAVSTRPSQPGVTPLEEEYRFHEIWIGDAEKFLNENQDTMQVSIINLRKNFCMYALHSALDAEFITNKTLAVSMHKDGDDYSFLWEITIDGKIVRQLTFEP